MARKIYESVTGNHITFPVTVSNVRHWIDLNPKYITSDAGIQGQIEASNYFTSGRVSLSGNYTDSVKSKMTSDVTAGGILTAEIKTAGTGYAVEDIIQLASANANAVLKVTEVDAGAVTAFEIIEKGQSFTAGDKAQASTTGIGTGFELTVLTVEPATEFPGTTPFLEAVFEEVININHAIAVLKAEPYKVHHMKLKTPEQVMGQAIDHSVRFPNWII